MSDLSYVVAAYAVVLGGVIAYAISLIRRGQGAGRRLSAIESRRKPPTARPEAVAATAPETELDLRSQ